MCVSPAADPSGVSRKTNHYTIIHHLQPVAPMDTTRAVPRLDMRCHHSIHYCNQIYYRACSRDLNCRANGQAGIIQHDSRTRSALAPRR